MRKLILLLLILTTYIVHPSNAFSERLIYGSSFINSIDQKFVYIKSGSFLMGSNFGEDDEKPVHRVKIKSGFYMQNTEVTQGQWLDVMGTRPWAGKKHVRDNKNNPVVYVTWKDAMEFVKRLNRLESKKYRLPTEAEWEYTCRAGSSSMYSLGIDETSLGDYAWYDENASKKGESFGHRVGTKRPNMWGLYDMHGNVWEWCENNYDDDYKSYGSEEYPMEPGYRPAYRGGSFSYSAKECRSSIRGWCRANDSFSNVGFRLVCIPVP